MNKVLKVVSTSYMGDYFGSYINSELTAWAYEEMLAGSRTKASRIFKVRERLIIDKRRREKK